jgi:hypothetical protein
VSWLFTSKPSRLVDLGSSCCFMSYNASLRRCYFALRNKRLPIKLRTSEPLHTPSSCDGLCKIQNPFNSCGKLLPPKNPKCSCSLPSYLGVDFWLGDQDSNLDCLRQRQMTYR